MSFGSNQCWGNLGNLFENIITVIIRAILLGDAIGVVLKLETYQETHMQTGSRFVTLETFAHDP